LSRENVESRASLSILRGGRGALGIIEEVFEQGLLLGKGGEAVEEHGIPHLLFAFFIVATEVELVDAVEDLAVSAKFPERIQLVKDTKLQLQGGKDVLVARKGIDKLDGSGVMAGVPFRIEDIDLAGSDDPRDGNVF
jgi:hypothetical protein